jgi:hypothetical protein
MLTMRNLVVGAVSALILIMALAYAVQKLA